MKDFFSIEGKNVRLSIKQKMRGSPRIFVCRYLGLFFAEDEFYAAVLPPVFTVFPFCNRIQAALSGKRKLTFIKSVFYQNIHDGFCSEF